MTHTPHDLADDFPNHVAELHDLKLSDAHFARLAERYNEVNHRIHLAETMVEPVSQQLETELRRERMVLKDQISRLLLQKPAP
jgi:uncharacterized protein YdcH (DUF465 family)